MDLPISALPNATIPLGGADLFAVAQSGQTRSVPASAVVGAGGYISNSTSQSATGGASMVVGAPPQNALVDITIVVDVTSVTTPGNLAIEAQWFGHVQEVADGPVFGNTAGALPSNFTASSNLGGAPQLVATSGCVFTFIQRAVVSGNTSILGAVLNDSAFVGTIDVFMTVTQITPVSFM